MASHSWGGSVNSTSMFTSDLPYIFTPGIGMVTGNLAANGSRPIQISSLGGAYGTNVNWSLNYAGSSFDDGSVFSASGGGFDFIANRTGGTMYVGRNTGAGGSTYWSDGDSLSGQMPGSFTWTTVPAAVGALTVSSAAAGTLTVSWSAPANGDSVITGYRVEVATDPSFTLNKAVADPAGTSTTVSGLLPGQLYYVRVAAKNAISTAAGTYGNWSSSSSILVLSGAKVGVSGTWKDASVYVGVNGEWKPCAVYVGSGGTWKGLTP